ncbi:MAG: threonine ammonia-lyase, biosynthetic, partial [Gammaproteobacteria bacterium]|nr:threonine ammonia-lyase, biosynthetic [Gammaproteobacteria bacterium]
MDSKYLQRILLARVYDVAHDTPLDYAANLSRRLKHDVWLKREDQQPIFSFKIRGAYNKMSRISPSVLKRGVVAASAGNHAQGVAMAGKTLGCPVTIFMPITSPEIKVKSVKSFGAKVKLVGDSYAEAFAAADAFRKRKGLRLISPYDDADIIAGNGTIGLEIMRSAKGKLDAIFVPVGGGGLIAGIATYVKSVSNNVKVIGVEPMDSDAMTRSLNAGKRIALKEVGIFADGVAVKLVGKECFRLVQKYVDDIVQVDTDETCAAIKDIFEDTRTIVEPSGALAVAGLKKYCSRLNRNGKGFVAVNTGANMNFDRLRHVSERAEIGERREAIIAVTIPERPGSFAQFCATIGDRGITEFNYRFADEAEAHVYCGVQISSREEGSRLIATLKRNDYPVL